MLAHVRRDIKRYNPQNSLALIAALRAAYIHPSFVGIVWYRMGHACWVRRKNPIFLIILILNRVLYPLIRLYSGLELSPRAEIGPGLYIAHFGPTVIHSATVAGCNLTLLQGVTIGEHTSGVPRIGDYVRIGTGACVIGGITIGDNAIVGAGAVVTKDVPAGCTVVGIPAKPVKLADEATESLPPTSHT